MIDIKQAMDAIDLRRRILDVDIQDLAKRADITPRTYTNWRRGALPQLRKFQRLQRAIDKLEKEHESPRQTSV